MSSAFQRELDREDAIPDLPDRPVSTARNLVTPEGLIQIENEVERWADELKKAQAAEDKAHVASAGRELRYWSARRSSPAWRRRLLPATRAPLSPQASSAARSAPWSVHRLRGPHRRRSSSTSGRRASNMSSRSATWSAARCSTKRVTPPARVPSASATEPPLVDRDDLGLAVHHFHGVADALA